MRRFRVLKPASVGKTESGPTGLEAFSHWCNLAALEQMQHRPLPYAISLVIASWREAARASAASVTATA